MNRFSLATFPLQNKTIFLRVDFNVPLTKGKIIDNKKIRASLPTIRFLLAQNCKIILATHLGRPQGKVVHELKVTPLVKELQALLPKITTTYLRDCLGKEIKKKIKAGKTKEIFFLENLRFYKEEEQNDTAFAHCLADLADVYVNDAFAAYRPHASVVGITKYLPSIAGLLMEKEILNLRKGLFPRKPVVWVLGGGKFSKLELLEKILSKADYILLGGALPFPFLQTQGIPIGMSKSNAKAIETAKKILRKRSSRKIILPRDFVVAKEFRYNSARAVVPFNQIPTNSTALDLGPETIEEFKRYLRGARTTIWNGPLGFFEWTKFAAATREIGRSIAQLTATSIAGGGETEEAIHKFHLEHEFTHISTGGGAAMAFLTGEKLMTLHALEKNYHQFKQKIKKKELKLLP